MRPSQVISPFQDDFEHCLATLVAEGSFPSFEEFAKNPDKFREQKEHLFIAIDGSMLDNRKELGKQKIFWRYGKESFTLEKLQRVCADHGYSPEDVDMMPFRMKNATGTGRDEILVRVFPKSELKLMGAVLPNA